MKKEYIRPQVQVYQVNVENILVDWSDPHHGEAKSFNGDFEESSDFEGFDIEE